MSSASVIREISGESLSAIDSTYSYYINKAILWPVSNYVDPVIEEVNNLEFLSCAFSSDHAVSVVCLSKALLNASFFI
jgi:hypothetical protein